MQLATFTVIGAALMVTAYALGVGGAVCMVIFLAVVFTGALLRVSKPIIDWATRP